MITIRYGHTSPVHVAWPTPNLRSATNAYLDQEAADADQTGAQALAVIDEPEA